MKIRTQDYKVIDSLVLYIKKLNDEAADGALVVVEGRRDAEALKSIGFQGKLYLLSQSEGLVKLTSVGEKYKRLILLLDLDSKGRSLTKKAALLLQDKKISFDLFFRKELISATKGRIRQVEELRRFREYIHSST